MESREKQLFMHVSFSDLKFGKLIGAGSFGEVFSGSWRGADVAIKRLNHSKLTKDALAEFEREISIMVELRHPNLVLYMAACVEPPNLCIVSELMSRGSLYEALHDDEIEFDAHSKISFMLDAAKGLQYLHLSSPPILHKDLKSPNLLLDQKWNLKISDFGLSGVRPHNGPDRGPQGTLFWMAPEIVKGEAYTTMADVYSFAIILYEIIYQSDPYPDDIAEAVAIRVANDGYRPTVNENENFPPRVISLMKECWTQDSRLRHPFSEIVPILSDQLASAPKDETVHASMRASSKSSSTPPLSGCVAVVFTSVEGINYLWERSPEETGNALAMHNKIMREALRLNKGTEMKTEGDLFVMSFSDPVSAIMFCMQAQEMLLLGDWPETITNEPVASLVVSKGATIFRGLRVRMAINFGEPIVNKDQLTGQVEYVGQVPQLASNLLGVTKGGQILITVNTHKEISSKVTQLKGASIRDLGHQIIRGIVSPVHIFEIIPASLQGRVIFFNDDGKNESSGPSLPNAILSEPNETKEEKKDWQINFSDLVMSSTELGAGSFGVVFLGTYKEKQVAIKKFMKQKMAEKQYFSFLAEVMLLRELKHEHILEFVGASVKQPNVCLVLEYAAFGSLRDLLSDSKINFNQQTNRTALCQISDAMRFLHSRRPPVLHRDMKSANVLVTRLNPIHIKIGDFGLARVKADNQTMTKCGTRAWLAPEILKGLRYDEKADVFSYGIVIWEVLTRERPYQNADPLKLNFDVANGLRPPIPKNSDVVLTQLMVRCWDGFSDSRPSFNQVYETLEPLCRS